MSDDNEPHYTKINEFYRGDWRATTTLTAGRIRALIAQARAAGELDSKSTVNPAFTRAQSLDIIERAIQRFEDTSGCRVVACKNLLRELGLPLGRVGEPWKEPTP